MPHVKVKAFILPPVCGYATACAYLSGCVMQAVASIRAVLDCLYLEGKTRNKIGEDWEEDLKTFSNYINKHIF